VQALLIPLYLISSSSAPCGPWIKGAYKSLESESNGIPLAVQCSVVFGQELANNFELTRATFPLSRRLSSSGASSASGASRRTPQTWSRSFCPRVFPRRVHGSGAAAPKRVLEGRAGPPPPARGAVSGGRVRVRPLPAQVLFPEAGVLRRVLRGR